MGTSSGISNYNLTAADNQPLVGARKKNTSTDNNTTYNPYAQPDAYAGSVTNRGSYSSFGDNTPGSISTKTPATSLKTPPPLATGVGSDIDFLGERLSQERSGLDPDMDLLAMRYSHELELTGDELEQTIIDENGEEILLYLDDNRTVIDTVNLRREEGLAAELSIIKADAQRMGPAGQAYFQQEVKNAMARRFASNQSDRISLAQVNVDKALGAQAKSSIDREAATMLSQSSPITEEDKTRLNNILDKQKRQDTELKRTMI